MSALEKYREHGGVRKRRNEVRARSVRVAKRSWLDDEGRHLPMLRADCVDGERPCPFVSCQYNLFLDVTDSGNIKENFPNREPDELELSCALDIADAGGATLEQTGAAMNLTRERVRQIENKALAKLERVMKRRKLELDDLVPSDKAISWFGERA